MKRIKRCKNTNFNEQTSSKYTGLVILFLLFYASVSAQVWKVERDQLLRDGKPSFLSGVNYLPSKNWLTILRNWDGNVVERDMQVLQSIGVHGIRFFPLWSMVQPQPDKLDPVILANLEKLLEIAGRHQIQFQITPLTAICLGQTGTLRCENVL